MIQSENAVRARFPRPGDVVLYGTSTDAEGKVREVPAMILEVHVPGAPRSRVDLETVKIGAEQGVHSGVPFADDAKQGRWRWRPAVKW